MPTPQEELITQKYSAWWAALGYYTINQGGAGSGAIVAPTAVTITGNTAVALNTDVALTANVDPGNVSLPLTYTWSVDGGTITSGAGTAVVEVQWSTSGSKSVSVQVSNAAGTVSDNHTVSVASPLLTDLAAYWKLDTLTWADSVGSNNLSNNGSVTVGTPKLGAGSAEFDGGNYLSLASNADVQNTGDLTISCWVRFASVADRQMIVTKDITSSREYFLSLNSSGNIEWVVRKGTLGAPVTGLSPVVNTWYHILAWYDSTSGTAFLAVNNGTPNSFNRPGTANTGNAEYRIGARQFVGFEDYISNGSRIDEVGIWKRLLTSSEMSDLYNGGSGLSYPFN